MKPQRDEMVNLVNETKVKRSKGYAAHHGSDTQEVEIGSIIVRGQQANS
jgi:hypothetical protein